MRDIREILEALGVTWKAGYMVCPSCSNVKLTASEKRNVASCWNCGQKWWPGKSQRNYLTSWGVTILRPLVKLCHDHLANSPRTVEWLSGTESYQVT